MEKKDKTYYVNVDGHTARIRAAKKPSKKTLEAIEAMVKVVKTKFKNNDQSTSI